MSDSSDHQDSSSMPDSELYAAIYLSRYRPSAGWATWVKPAYEQLMMPSDPDTAARVWVNLAIMLGDTRAAPLGVFVLLYARSLGPTPPVELRIQAHLDLCLIDLGLARAKNPGPVLLTALGEPGVVDTDGSALSTWLTEQLSPFEGSLRDAATFVVRLAALRTGILRGPFAPSVRDLLNASLFVAAAD